MPVLPLLLACAGPALAADDRVADPAPPADAWTLEQVERLLATPDAPGFRDLPPPEAARMQSAVITRHWLDELHVDRSDWATWLTASLSADPSVRDRAVRGAFYGGLVTAEGALRVPPEAALQDWRRARVEIGSAAFAVHLERPGLVGIPFANVGAEWAEATDSDGREAGVWAARVHGEAQVSAVTLAAILHLDGSQCSSRLAQVGVGPSINGGPPSAIYARIADRPDQCFDRDAVRHAADRADRLLRKQLDLEGYVLTDPAGAWSEGTVRLYASADGSDVPAAGGFELDE